MKPNFYSGTTIEMIGLSTAALCLLIIAAAAGWMVIFKGRYDLLIVAIPCLIVAIMCVYIQVKKQDEGSKA